MSIKSLLQTADWKTEKHVPVIEVTDSLKKGESAEITVSVGKEIAHPNTTEHHINWIAVYFLPEAAKFPYCLGKFEFSSHGASTEGPNTSTVYTEPKVCLRFKTEKSGTVLAVSFCNVHGLWEDSKELKIS